MHVVRPALKAFFSSWLPPKAAVPLFVGVRVLSSVSALVPWLKHPHQKLSFTTTALLDAPVALAILTQSWAPH